mgnify:CR=1 FL=1
MHKWIIRNQPTRRKKMIRSLIVLLIAVLASGCASAASDLSYPSLLPVPERSASEEGRVRNMLVGTWSGYVVRNRFVTTVHPDITLQISEVRKGQNGWAVGATVNVGSVEYTELYVSGESVQLRVMTHAGGLITLTPYGNTHLVGGIAYGRGRWTPHDLSLKRISR